VSKYRQRHGIDAAPRSVPADRAGAIGDDEQPRVGVQRRTHSRTGARDRGETSGTMWAWKAVFATPDGEGARAVIAADLVAAVGIAMRAGEVLGVVRLAEALVERGAAR
jgi:hypothetical protein